LIEVEKKRWVDLSDDDDDDDDEECDEEEDDIQYE
jgi:hypothetical protein